MNKAWIVVGATLFDEFSVVSASQGSYVGTEGVGKLDDDHSHSAGGATY